jgi:hypothetical protein
MNDLEHDLRDVFERHAGDIGSSTLAPDHVLRRGRRRQVTTSLGGAVAAVGGIAIAMIVGASLLRHPTTQIPSNEIGTAPYGERTATIQGVSLTAPAGWTLVDDWPLGASMITTTTSCTTFSASGVPVNSSGEAALSSDGGSAPTAAEPSRSCTTQDVPVPAGVPVLQLANFEVPLGETVCGLEDRPAATVPDAGVSVYVAQAASEQALELAACPGGSEITSFRSSDGRPASAILVVGVDASQDDLAIARTFMDQIASATLTGSMPVSIAPGYVVAAGADAGGAWRIESTLSTAGSRDSATLVAAATVTDVSGEEHAYEVASPTAGQLVAAAGHVIADDGTTLMWGVADPRVEALDVVADTGSWAGTLVPWPTGLGATGISTAGSVWWTVTPPVKSAFSVTLFDGTKRLLSGDNTSPAAR